MKPLTCGKNSIIAAFLEEWFWHQINQEGWYTIKQGNQDFYLRKLAGTTEWRINGKKILSLKERTDLRERMMVKENPKLFYSNKLEGSNWFKVNFLFLEDIIQNRGLTIGAIGNIYINFRWVRNYCPRNARSFFKWHSE